MPRVPLRMCSEECQNVRNVRGQVNDIEVAGFKPYAIVLVCSYAKGLVGG